MVKRLQENALPGKHHKWIGNDEKGGYHQNQFARSESPLYMHLSWKGASDAPKRLIGCYELDMTALLASEYIREDGSHNVRLRFVHADDGIYIQKNNNGPRFRVDMLCIEEA